MLPKKSKKEAQKMFKNLNKKTSIKIKSVK